MRHVKRATEFGHQPSNTDYQRRRRARLRAAGLCLQCGAFPIVVGKSACQVCRAIQKAQNQAAYEKARAIAPTREYKRSCEWCGGRSHTARTCTLAKHGIRDLAPEIKKKIGGLP